MSQPWTPGETPDEQAARREAYERLAGAARRVGMSLDRLGHLLRQLLKSEVETRRFLAEEVYGVPDEALDDLLRIRLGELDEPPPDEAP